MLGAGNGASREQARHGRDNDDMNDGRQLRRTRVRASPLTGRDWLNTGGRTLSLADLRGKIVLLDFWTFCCVNCLHVLDELRPVEQRFAAELIVIGVHSPKFEHEADPVAVADAVERYGVHHPVLDDPQLSTWSAYTARAWPTLVVIDPEGYVVAQMSGEGHAHGLTLLLDELVAEHETKGTLHRGDGPYVPPIPPGTALRFPGKALKLPDGGWLVSDTAHHQLVELEPDLATERRRIGCGARGLVDGPAEQAAFAEPQGVALLPPAAADLLGVDVVVADSANHAVRGVRLADGAVTTLAGTGEQLRTRPAPGVAGSAPPGSARAQRLSTPWDLVWFQHRLIIAMAGNHQLWALDPGGADGPTLEAVVGTTYEGLLDGSGPTTWMAQPSGLAVDTAQQILWVVDSETSALRSVRATGAGLEVGTVVGQGLFDFGHVDGPAERARLQHPLGVAVLPDGSVAVADTYNGAVRRYEPKTGEVGTLADGLAEPSDVSLEQREGAEPVLVVVESAAHRLVRVPLPAHVRQVGGAAQRTQRPVTKLVAGAVRLSVAFVPPTGQKLDDRWGEPARLTVSATPGSLLASGSGSGSGLVRNLVLAGDEGREGVLHVSVQAAACDGDPLTGAVPEHAACHLYQQDWGIPVLLGASGYAELSLDLRGA